jgi:nicotinate-nucleotide adenylyltransferase
VPLANPSHAGTPRIGILGGTFDPPHIGHLIVAAEVRRQLDLDQVLVVVANDPWQKTGVQAVSPAADRMAMVQVAISGHDWLVASSIEIDRGGPSYMADTLRELRRRQAATWFVILGADAYAGLPTWHEAAVLPELCQFVVVGRPHLSGDNRVI